MSNENQNNNGGMNGKDFVIGTLIEESSVRPLPFYTLLKPVKI